MPPETNAPQTKSQSKTLLVVALLVLVLIAAGAAWYFLKKNPANSGSTYEKGLYNQTFNTTSNFSLKGSKAGSGLSFSAPTQYKLAYESAAHDQMSLANAAVKGGQSFFQGAIYAASVPEPGATGLQKNYEQIFAKPGTNSYQSTLIVIHQFLSSRFSNLYTITYASPTPFTSSTISADAWQIDFTATPKQTQPANSMLEKYTGRIVFAVGPKAFYYFAGYTTSYNWDNNLSTWSRVFSSLKIDQ